MKNYKHSKIAVLIFGLFCLFSCTDMLDQEPLGLATPQNFWVSQANVESALAGDYALLKETLIKDSNFMLWGEFTGMTFMDSHFWIVDYIEGSGNYVLAYRDDSRNWKGFYRAANWALSIEKHVSEMPDSDFRSKVEKNRLIGEAAFIRSLSYFYLARIWGDAPIVDEVIETSDQLIKDGYIVTKPRENELKVLDFALAAANKAISLLEYSTPGAPKWAITANKASAEALKAHITLWYASRDHGNPAMLAQALVAANSVIQNSNASLIDYVNEGAEGFNDMCIGQSKTGLFEINISSAMNESYRVGGDNTMTGLTLTDPFYLNPNQNAPVINDDFYGKDMMNSNPDRDNDKRKELFFSDFDSNEQSSLMKYSQATRDGQSTDPYARFSESNILIFRLADVYLLRAEANMKLGNTATAVSDINMIRSKANVPDYTGPTDLTSLTKAIFDERAIEFVGEGQAGFDRIRMNYYAGVSWMTPSRISHQGYFWPVAPSIISINAAIVQTDFWKGKL
jgi:hypothetical protein